MSTVQEIKEAAITLTSEERVELARWLAETAEPEIGAGETSRHQWLSRWRELIAKTNAVVGPITWKRDELYER